MVNQRFMKFITILPVILIITLLVLGIYTGNMFFSIIALIINIIFFAFLKPEDIMCYLLLLLPFATIYKINPESTSFLTILEVISIVLISIKLNYRRIRIPIVFFIFFVYLIVFDVLNSNFAVVEYFRQFLGLVILYLFTRQMKIDSIKKDNNSSHSFFALYQRFIVYFTLGLLISSSIALLADKFPYFYSYVRKIGYDSEIQNRFSGLNGDPNYYSINIIMSMIGLFFLYIKRKIRISFWFIFLILSLFGIITYSKSFILMYIIVLLFIAFMLLKNSLGLGLVIFLVFSSVTIILFSMGKIPYLNLLMRRFTNIKNLSDLTTGRLNLWLEYVTFLIEHPVAIIIGVGIGANYLSGGSHNWYIESIYYLGLLGTMLYFYCIYKALSIKILFEKNRVIKFFGFITLMIMYFFLQMLFSNELPFHFVIAYAIYVSYKDGNEILSKKNEVNGVVLCN